MIDVVTWLWDNGSHTFGPDYVSRLRSMVARHLHLPHRFSVVADRAWLDHGLDPSVARIDPPREFRHAPNCIRRMKMYEPRWAGNAFSDHVLLLDLDVVIVDDITPLVAAPLDAAAELALWRVGYPCHNRIYAGGVVLMVPGVLRGMWDAFVEDPLAFGTRALKHTYDREPGAGWGAISDQAMLNYWTHLQGQGLARRMWQWTSEIQPYNSRMESVPPGAKMITIGHENAQDFQRHAWAHEHWR
jgi:hypothetical protein